MLHSVSIHDEKWFDTYSVDTANLNCQQKVACDVSCEYSERSIFLPFLIIIFDNKVLL